MNNYPFINYSYQDYFNEKVFNDVYNNKTDYNNKSSNYNSNNNYNDNLYDPYNGLIRGNLFKNLYDPYKISKPYEIKPANEQAKLLTEIDSLVFALEDLNLYLDIHTDDRNAINLFNQYRQKKESLLKEYESKYGPLTLNSDSLNSYPWAWDNMPWPWDK